MSVKPTIRPLLSAGVLLGISLAAFFDGIVLHQLLQWHHMICDERSCHALSVADLEAKNRADGWFHLAAYGVLLLGITGIYRAGRTPGLVWSGAGFGGALLMGAGSFNIVEGIIDHHILGIHHVRFGANRDVYDFAFLAVSAVIFVMGVLLLRRARVTLYEIAARWNTIPNIS
jgi:uncharacterized membrane protein